MGMDTSIPDLSPPDPPPTPPPETNLLDLSSSPTNLPSSSSSSVIDCFEDFDIVSALSPLENSLLPAGASWIPIRVAVSLEHFLVPHDWETFYVMNYPGLENPFTVQSSRLCSKSRPIHVSTCQSND